MQDEKCTNCVEPCPMADMAHEAAKGRMYATNEFISLLKKVECGQLVEVVRCKGCKHHRIFLKRDMCAKNAQVLAGHEVGLTATNPDDFCSYGEKAYE